MVDAQIARMEKTVQELIRLDLNPGHVHVICKENPSATLPYHNAGHCCTVGLNCLAGAESTGMSPDEAANLFLAGLYHDYDHSGGKCTDDVNIARAVKGMAYWCSKLEGYDAPRLDAISSIISATIWPAELFKGTRNLSQSIICDADHMQYLEPDAMSFVDGIGLETGQLITVPLTLQFLASYEPKTEWGTERLREIRQAKLERFNA